MISPPQGPLWLTTGLVPQDPLEFEDRSRSRDSCGPSTASPHPTPKVKDISKKGEEVQVPAEAMRCP